MRELEEDKLNNTWERVYLVSKTREHRRYNQIQLSEGKSNIIRIKIGNWYDVAKNWSRDLIVKH